MNAVLEEVSTATTQAIQTVRALQLLWITAQSDTGGSRVCVKLLLGLYNGRRFPFDLTDLRCLDGQHLEAALRVIRMDARPQMEVHELLNKLYRRDDIGHRFELLACDWALKGRCNKTNEATLRKGLERVQFTHIGAAS